MTLATSADSGDVCIAMAPTVSLGTSVDAAGAESVRVCVCLAGVAGCSPWASELFCVSDRIVQLYLDLCMIT